MSRACDADGRDNRDVRGDEDAGSIAALTQPPAACPGCLAAAGAPWPDGTTTRHCPTCLGLLRRVFQCQRWNAEHAHQVLAGQASWLAFSARWRASSGLAPLSAEAVRRYVTPAVIRGPVGAILPERVRVAIYRAWCAGQLLPLEAWLEDDPPPDPDGLWATGSESFGDVADGAQTGEACNE